MSLTLTQADVTDTATEVAVAAPGARVTLLASAAATVGTSASVTTTSGFMLAAGVPVTLVIPEFAGQQPVTLYGIAASAATVSVAIASEP